MYALVVRVGLKPEAFEAHEQYAHTRRFLVERERMIESCRVEFLDPIDGKLPTWQASADSVE